jgi:hypothetical protein
VNDFLQQKGTNSAKGGARLLTSRSLNSQPSTYLNCKTHCPKRPGDVISLRHETKVDGTPITDRPAAVSEKNQNDQNQNLTKIISRSFCCCPLRN